MVLNWPKRFLIINGIVRGLLYLHQDFILRIIHRDLKTNNILLDSEMNQKISDFGIAKSFGGNEIEANTNTVVGTYGYMSPENAIAGLYSTKSDIYSFDVLVLEIAWTLYMEGRSWNLLIHQWEVPAIDLKCCVLSMLVCYVSNVLQMIDPACLL
ncbi:G-type lectin S-receptor-like serine/threonine-protein kinase B120 [Vitis vinifera]|uniref:G-type lectin S-receptor-like serine/threonine-protein kinase B120 n=1 Tax=Vitis vinifera TaxID=29760 RepID=UPI002883324A|nr:G-type lectin S-receptor-like serine/threonine-protein kinase B120 [Vitis vinifera]